MTLRRIACAIDFSPEADQALRVAAQLAARGAAELVLAHAWHAGEYSLAEFRFTSPAIEQMIEDDQRRLADAVREARRLGAPVVAAHLLVGNPWQVIVEELSSQRDVDLVVMGTRGRSGLSRILLGSVAEKIVRHAPCPVLVVRERAAAAAFRKVMCPVDFTASSRHALALAAQLVEPGGAGIVLLHSIEVPTADSEGTQQQIAERLDRHTRDTLERWADELRARVAVPVTTAIRVGHAGAQILRALDADPTFDLVVTGSTGATGLRRALLGSVAEKVVRHAACPVLVARPRAEA